MTLLDDLHYVSRGGDKLATALNDTCLTVDRLIALDIGSSTGGFTDCLLKRGAAYVYAVDVGSGQFDNILAKDTRVFLFENTDIRNFLPELFFDIIVGDISFISWEYVVFDVVRLSKKGTKILLLIKPQFEVGKEYNKNGVVTDVKLHEFACEKIQNLFEKNEFCNIKVFSSILVGGDGNKEFFCMEKSVRYR